jgi:hypothetical protein
MNNDLANDPSYERYLIEMDGITKSEHRIFVKALKAGLKLKRQYPHSDVKVRDAYEKASPPAEAQSTAGFNQRSALN